MDINNFDSTDRTNYPAIITFCAEGLINLMSLIRCKSYGFYGAFLEAFRATGALV